MSENPYRRNAELSPQMQRIGGLLFVAALATPFAVIALVGGPQETALMAAGESTVPEFRDRRRSRAWFRAAAAR